MRRHLGLLSVAALWLILAVFAWLLPAREFSLAERRKLAQKPAFTASGVLDGSYMEAFGKAAVDQFPAREGFRQVKALFHRYGLSQRDTNGIYYTQGQLAKLDYPVDTDSVQRATGIFNRIYEKYLAPGNCRVFCGVIPDKGYYLAEKNGYPVMDYQALFTQVVRQMPWATHIDLTDTLTAESFYRTDTHWRQECLLPAAGKIASALEVAQPKAEDYTFRVLPEDFYGVYYGQAALPLPAEKITLLENDVLEKCRVYNFATKKYGSVYDEQKRQGKDLYEVYLSGPQAILVIENPNAATDRELLIFRDSFASSIAPLLVQDYRKVTLVDIRSVSSALLDRHLTFRGQDVLFLYSTLILNDSTTLK